MYFYLTLSILDNPHNSHSNVHKENPCLFTSNIAPIGIVDPEFSENSGKFPLKVAYLGVLFISSFLSVFIVVYIWKPVSKSLTDCRSANW